MVFLRIYVHVRVCPLIFPFIRTHPPEIVVAFLCEQRAYIAGEQTPYVRTVVSSSDEAHPRARDVASRMLAGWQKKLSVIYIQKVHVVNTYKG